MLCIAVNGIITDDQLALEPDLSFELKIDSVRPFVPSRVAIVEDTLEIFIEDDDGKFLVY